MNLTKNVGGIDKVLRLVLGALGIGAGVYMGWWWLAGVGAVIFLTGIVGRCGLYYVLGINTCPIKER